MYAWLLRGLATSVFEDRVYRLARTSTRLGVMALVLSMIFGVRDGISGTILHFVGPFGGWLMLKAGLAVVLLGIYGIFLYKSRHKRAICRKIGASCCGAWRRRRSGS